jgi:DNA-binding GntR family transcriptional regulator
MPPSGASDAHEQPAADEAPAGQAGTAASGSVWSAVAPIRSSGLAGEATYRLREAILDGRLPAGLHIVERDISEAFELSRGPIREALRHLEAEGLVEISPRRGARVAVLSGEDADEVIALRAAVEPVATSFGLNRHPKELIADLRVVLDRLQVAVEQQDWPAAMLLDLEFHETTYRHAGARRTQRVWQSVRPVLLRAFRLHPQVYASGGQLYASHRDLLRTFESESVDAACTAAREHVLDLTPAVLRLLTADSGNTRSPLQDNPRPGILG